MTFPTLCVSFFFDLGVAAKTVCNLVLWPVGWKWPDFFTLEIVPLKD